MIEQRLRKRTALLEVDFFSPCKLEFFCSRMDEFAVEGTPSEDFLEVLARIQAVGLRRKIKVRE